MADDTFTNQFFNVDGENIRNLNRGIARSLIKKEREYHDKIEKEQILLNFVVKVGLFLQLKTNNNQRGEEIYQRLTNEPYNMQIDRTDLIVHESDIAVCESLLEEAKRLKISFDALEKIKLIKKLWDDAIAAEKYCMSYKQHVLKLIYGDCFSNLEKSIIALRRSGIFSREYYNADDFAAAEGDHVRNGQPISPDRDAESVVDWFNGLTSRFRNRTLAGIEEHYERLKNQRDQEMRIRAENIDERPRFDFRAKRGKKSAKKSMKKTKKSAKKTKKSSKKTKKSSKKTKKSVKRRS
jgi:hypothetical protein